MLLWLMEYTAATEFIAKANGYKRGGILFTNISTQFKPSNPRPQQPHTQAQACSTYVQPPLKERSKH